jgi:hypothetical protein
MNTIGLSTIMFTEILVTQEQKAHKFLHMLMMWQ